MLVKINHFRSRREGLLPSRLIFVNAETAGALQLKENQSEIQIAVDQSRQEYAKKLSGKISRMEKVGRNAAEIKEELKSHNEHHTTEVLQTAVKKLNLREEGSLITYEDLATDPQTKDKIKTYFDKVKSGMDADIDQAVDTYFEKIAKTKERTKTALTKLPEPTSQPEDFDRTNPEVARLEEAKSKRQKALAESKHERQTITREIARTKAMSEIDYQTDPDRENAPINDYEDSLNPMSEETDKNNRVRRTLDGFLYGVYIFNGAGEAGTNAVDAQMDKAKQLHEVKYANRFDYSDLEDGMGLKLYLVRAEKYSSYDRVKGLIAGLLKQNDDFTADASQRAKYEEYLVGEFAKLAAGSTKSNEDAQLDFLFKIKPIADMLHVQPDWHRDYGQIHRLTNPERDDAGIDDYEGTDSEDNPVRRQLEGAMFGAKLWGGMGRADRLYSQASALFEQSSEGITTFGTRFDQKYIDDEKGLGLGKYIDEAKTWSTFDNVRAAMAEMLKLTTEEMTDQADQAYRDQYLSYLRAEFSRMAKVAHTEEEQLNFLATIRAPKVAVPESRDETSIRVIDLLQQAAKKHPELQFKTPGVTALLEGRVRVVQDASGNDDIPADETFKKAKPALYQSELQKKYLDISGEALLEIQAFVKNKNEQIPTDLQKKFDFLNGTNERKEKLISSESLDLFQKRIDGISAKLASALKITDESKLEDGVQKDYLDTLYQAQKDYYSLAKDLDAEIAEAAVEKKTEEKVGGGKEGEKDGKEAGKEGGKEGGKDGTETGGEKGPELDIYAANWKKGKDSETALGNYQGILVLNSGSDSMKVMIRGNNGRVFDKLINSTEVTRDAEDLKAKPWEVENMVFVRVTFNGKKGWIGEDYLFPKETSTTSPAPSEKKPEKKPETKPAAPTKPETKNEGLVSSNYDLVFNRLSKDVETKADGGVFMFTFNERFIPCRVQKMANGYGLYWDTPDTGSGNLLFPNLGSIREAVEGGSLAKNITVNQLQYPSVWARYQSELLAGEAKEVKRTGDYSVFVELDWQRNTLFETGNAKINLNVENGGVIKYRIEKDFVGPQGETVRSGAVSSLNQLIEVISHSKQWSEKYKENSGESGFAYLLNREKLATELTSRSAYESRSSEIGRAYDFRSYLNLGYTIMSLDWANLGNSTARHRSTENPTVELMLNTDSSITYKIYNASGLNGRWMGASGNVKTLGEVFSTINLFKLNPKAHLVTPYENLTKTPSNFPGPVAPIA